MLITQRVAAEALKKADGLSIADLCIGIGYTGVKLSNGAGGTCFTFRHELGLKCGPIQGAGTLIGMPAADAIEMAMSTNLAEASIGVATINAILNEDFDAGEDAVDVMDIRASDTVGMVGYFYPVVQRIKDNVKKLYIFERHITDEGLLPDWCENIYLDYKNQALVLHILKKLSQRGITIIMTSHFPNHVWSLGDKVAMMGYDGFVAMGKVEEVMTEENLSRTYGIDVHIYEVVKNGKIERFCTPEIGL